MVATIVSGLTNVSLVNNNTGFSVWKRDGTGGTPSAISETDVFLQGGGACSVKVSNQGVVLAYGTGGLNLSASNTHVYIWANMLAGGLMTARASNGLCICLSSDATLSTGSNYSFWAVDGSDTYPGGWVRYVIDVSKTRTTGAGTLNLSSVQHIGMYCDTRPNVAKFDNLVLDRIDYTTGTGLRVYGTSTTDDTFGDILADDEGNSSNKYGIVTSKEGVIYVRGSIELGDDTGTNACNLTDVDKVIVFEDPQYYNGTSVADATSSAIWNLNIVGNGTGSTTVQFGKKVGTGDTARGRNGLVIIGNGTKSSMDFDDGNANDVKVYGSTIRQIGGTLAWGTNTAHEFIGNTIDACAQFDPVGGIVQRNNTYSGFSGTTAAMLWNSSIDIKNSNFLANTDGTNNPAGIQHTTVTILESGTITTPDGTGTTLIDSTATFVTNGVAANDSVTNITDGSHALVVSVDSETQLTTTALTGGTGNDYGSSDSYSVGDQVTYDNLQFSGNDYDIYNSDTDTLTISKTNGANPSTYNTSGAFVNFVGSVTVSFEAVDSTDSPIQGVRVYAYRNSDNAEIINTTTNASGIASTSYSGSTPADITYRFRKSSSGATKYKFLSGPGTIESGTGLSVKRAMEIDPVADPTI